MPATERADYDQALKALLGRAHDGFLALVAPDLTWRAALIPELPSIARQADFAWEVVRRDGRRGLLHLELQVKVEPELAERVTEYGLRLWRRYHRPVRSVIVLLRSTRRRLESPFRMAWGDEERLRYHFDVVRLWEQPQEAVLGQADPALWPLATLMAGATVATSVAVAERLGQAGLGRAERTDLTGLVAALAGLRLPRERVLQALRRDPMIREILDETSVAEFWREEGREEGQRKTVRQVLESRFGPLDAAVGTALHGADAPTLQALVAHLTTDTLADVRQRLGLA